MTTTDTLQYTNSKELLQPNYLKEWKGFTLTRQLKEGETLQEAADKLVAEVDQLHQKYSQSFENQMKGTVIEPVETRTTEEITTDQQVQGYYQIIELAKTHQQLAKHQGNIEKLGNEKLTNTFHEKLNQLKP